MKALMILVAATLLAGCGKAWNRVDDGDFTGHDFAVVCLDGVEYWVRVAPGKAYMAVRINPETLQPATCTGE